jgi:hypothetical protein
VRHAEFPPVVAIATVWMKEVTVHDFNQFERRSFTWRQAVFCVDALNEVDDLKVRWIKLHLLDLGGDISGNGLQSGELAAVRAQLAEAKARHETMQAQMEELELKMSRLASSSSTMQIVAIRP